MRRALSRVAHTRVIHGTVRGLKLELDYRSVSAGMTPFSIGQISHEAVTYATGYNSYRWRISINGPEGFITFEAPGFTQR